MSINRRQAKDKIDQIIKVLDGLKSEYALMLLTESKNIVNNHSQFYKPDNVNLDLFYIPDSN